MHVAFTIHVTHALVRVILLPYDKTLTIEPTPPREERSFDSVTLEIYSREVSKNHKGRRRRRFRPRASRRVR